MLTIAWRRPHWNLVGRQGAMEERFLAMRTSLGMTLCSVRMARWKASPRRGELRVLIE